MWAAIVMSRRRVVGTLALALLCGLVLTACERLVTHETGSLSNAGYDASMVGASGNATIAISSAHAYENSGYSAQAHYAGYTGTGTPPASRAYTGFEVPPGEGEIGTMAAAFYFPVGTFTGSTPAQEGRVEIMRWEAAEQTFGTIRINSDHKARLMRTKNGVGEQQIGDEFTLQEGCWNWLAVNQKVSTANWDSPDHATSRIYLNGRKIVDSDMPNAYATSDGSQPLPLRVRFGMAALQVGTGSTHQNDRDLDVYVDNAYISDGTIPAPGATACEPPEPNILFIVTDDQRAYNTMHEMPNTLKWFRNGGVEAGHVITPGVEYGQAYATTPLCCPARASILTGKYAHNHMVRNNGEEGAVFGTNVGTQIQSILKAGCGDSSPETPCYRTGIAGKYFNDWNPYLEPPNFDEYWIGAGYLAEDTQSWTGGGYFNNNGTIECRSSGTSGCTYGTDYLRDKAIEFINSGESNDSQPWFFYLAPFAPHSDLPLDKMAGPYASYDPGDPPDVPSRHEGPSTNPAATNPIADKPAWVRNYAQGLPIMGDGGLHDNSLRALKALDDAVGLIFDELKTKGEERDTIAIYVSDNGLMWREHGMAETEGTGGTTCPPGCGLSSKAKPYLESVKVPMLMRWPADSRVYQASMDSTRFVGSADLAPTALEAAGLPIPNTMDGRSLLDRTQVRDEILTENWAGAAGQWASLRGRIQTPDAGVREFQYIEYYGADGKTPTFTEYYDLTSDPWELDNLLSTPPFPEPTNPPRWIPDTATINTLSARLGAARVCKGATCPPGPGSAADVDPPRIEAQTLRDGQIVDLITAGKQYPFTVRAFDNIGIAQVEFTIDGVSQTPADTQWPYSLVLKDLAPGTHQLKAVATDTATPANQSAQLELTIKVDQLDVQAQDAVEASTPSQTQYNASSRLGFLQQNDWIRFTLNRVFAPSEIKSGWGGSPTSVTVRILPDVGVGPGEPPEDYNDAIVIPEVPNLGTLHLTHKGFWGWRLPDSQANVPATMTIAADQRSVQLTLGPVPGGIGRSPLYNTMMWEPGTAICGPPTCGVAETPPGTQAPDSEF